MLNIRTVVDYGHYFYPSRETSIDFTTEQSLDIHPGKPDSASSRAWHNVKMQHGKLKTALHGFYEMTCSEQRFFIRARWRAWADQECVFEKEFDHEIERRLV